MFLLNLIRYIRGYVEFCVKGAFIERFLNLAARERIPIWDGRKRGDTFMGKTIAGSYRKLRKHAKKTNVKMHVTQKYGAPFKRQKYRKRTGLLAGLCIFFGFTFLMSRFIWRVEVNGNELVAENEIIGALEEIGVTPGRLRTSIDVRSAERRALLELDGLSWIALNIRGGTVHVEVKERGPMPFMVDPRKPCNIVSSRSGQIVSLLVYSGQTVKTVGDTVLEGDIIVSGITEDRLGQNLFRHARAKVKAKVEHQIIVETPLVQNRFIETGIVKKRRFLHIFDWDIPLFLPFKIQRPYHVEREKNMLTVGETELPLGILYEEYFLMNEGPVKYTEDEAKKLALKELAIREKAELDGAEIISKSAVGSSGNGVFLLKSDYLCIMDIAQEVEILKSE